MVWEVFAFERAPEENSMWNENKVRIIDIAEELGVSTATVSNVIHGKTKKISDKTVEMVQRKLQERGYIPNMAATLLAQNNSRIIGVIIKNHCKYEGHLLEDPFISAAINYLSDAIEEAGYFMMLKKASDIREIVKFSSMWNLDGMVVLSFCADEYQQLRNEIRIPFVVYDGFFENRGRICNLIIDDYDGGRQVGQHFRALGHTNVLCIADNKDCMDLKRYQGLCEGLGFEADFLQIPMQKEQRRLWYQEHLEQIEKYSAIFAVSDYYAVDLMQFLQAQGIHIPGDISVAGFDGTPICSQIVPTLTSVYQDNRERAYMAVDLLQKMREEPEYTGDFVLPVRLVPGDSTARCQ